MATFKDEKASPLHFIVKNREMNINLVISHT